jgi:peptidyl-prolyl cis-trans isomerase SurA
MKSLLVPVSVLLVASAAFAQTSSQPAAPAPQVSAPRSALPQTPRPTTTSKSTVVEDIIARVNDNIVTRTELERSREQLLNEIHQQDPNAPESKIRDREKDLLRDLIDQQLLLDKGKDLDINADTAVIKRLDEMRKQMNLGSMEDLEKAAEAQGVSYEDFRQNLKNEIITQEVIGREVGPHVAITPEEEKQFYEKHKTEMDRPEQIRLSEILIAPKPPQATQSAPQADAQAGPNAESQPALDPQAQAEADKQAEARAQQVLAEIKKGAAFDAVAKKFSDGPTAAQGGDLGYFKRGTLAKELEDKTFALKAGETTDVIRTKQGFVILKVTEHQKGGVPPFNEVEPQVQNAIYMQKLQPALRDYLKKLREDAYIDIKPGYVDTGASPNQTKPIEMSGNSPIPGKKLKKKKKLGMF